jgi:hypothetical protein
MKNLTFAVLVDGENASPKDFFGVLREVEKKGDVALKRVYADWTMPHQAGWKDVLHETGARPVQQFNYGKDAADHALIMDAIELTIDTPRLDAVCIVSSDGGFHTLALRIREKGLYVMGIGRRNTPERLRRACHHFVYADLLDMHEADAVTPEDGDLDELLVKAYQASEIEGEAVYLGALGSQLKRFDPAFDPRSYSFTTLKSLIKANRHLFDVVSETEDRFFIRLKSGVLDAKPPEVLEGTVTRWISHFGFIEASGKAYYFAKVNVDETQREHRFSKGDRVRFVVSSHPVHDATNSANQNGKAKDVEILSALNIPLVRGFAPA